MRNRKETVLFMEGSSETIKQASFNLLHFLCVQPATIYMLYDHGLSGCMRDPDVTAGLNV